VGGQAIIFQHSYFSVSSELRERVKRRCASHLEKLLGVVGKRRFPTSRAESSVGIPTTLRHPHAFLLSIPKCIKQVTTSKPKGESHAVEQAHYMASEVVR